jgi:LAGLIDADG endonuclease
MGSENLPGAVNQQERPTHSSWLDRIPHDLGHYVAGFVDGEGSFNVPIRRERDRTMPLRAGLSFNVSQIGRDIPELLLEVFGCGTVRERKDGVVYFEVTRPSDLKERVIPFLRAVPAKRIQGAGPQRVHRDHATSPVRRTSFAERSQTDRRAPKPHEQGWQETTNRSRDRSTTRGMGILRGHTQGSLIGSIRDEDMVHAPWRHGELHEL